MDNDILTPKQIAFRPVMSTSVALMDEGSVTARSFWTWIKHLTPLTISDLACVAGVRKGRGRELGRETTRSRAPSFPLPFPLLTPATQAISDLSSNLLDWI